MMEESLLPPNVLNLLGLPDSHPRTTVLSVQAKTEFTGMLSIRFVWQSSLVRTQAPHSSSLGIDNRFIGETLVLEMTSAVCIFFVESLTRRHH